MPTSPQQRIANEALRVEAAGALRDLLHAFVGHEIDDADLIALRDWARDRSAGLGAGAARSRLELMQAAFAAHPGTGFGPGGPGSSGAGFEDRAVAGRANPTGLVFETWHEGDVILADVTLGSACEGAPGRSHGGIVAAAFDDLTGAVIGTLDAPAFTGELTVRFLRPVPIGVPLRFRTWLDSRDGRKIHIHADASVGDELLATCKALYIAVDPSVFAGAPDPR